MAEELYHTAPGTAPGTAPPPVETSAPPPGQTGTDPNALARRLLLIVLILLLTVGVGGLLGRALKTKSSGQKSLSPGESSLPEAKGKLVGVYLRNGTAYFGTLVFEDDKTMILRDVYLPLGFFPRREGGEPVLQVAKFSETSPDSPNEQIVQKDEILFSSGKISPEIVRAIERYVPPTPTPTPTPTPSPLPSPALASPTPSSAAPTPTPTPTPTPGAEKEPKSAFGI